MHDLKKRRLLSQFLEFRVPVVRCCLIVIASVSFCEAVHAATAQVLELRITHRARSLQPGEVVLLILESPKALRAVRGTAFGKTFPFYSDQSGRVWRGLIGIDLETRAGKYFARLHGSSVDGAPFDRTYPLNVRDKRFLTRRLTVEERFVTPPKEEEERIRRESRRTEAIFETVTPERIWRGSFTVPVKAPAGSSFGRGSILNGKPRSPHSGTDFSADTGTPVRAPNSGRIVLAADLYFSGNTVIVDHGLGLYSFLAHLSQFSVLEGDGVKAGQVIGRVGATGRATGPHLHWSVRLAGMRVDPLSLVAALAADSDATNDTETQRNPRPHKK